MKKIIAIVGLLTPAVALAQSQPITDVNQLTAKLVGIGNLVTYLLVALAVIFIIWNVIFFLIRGADDQEARGKAASRIISGIVGLFIILSIWGLVNILVGTFRTTPTNTAIPQVQNINQGNIPIVP
jgi:nitrogen fixation/metabolism regulation signal transduction histidine kinase